MEPVAVANAAGDGILLSDQRRVGAQDRRDRHRTIPQAAIPRIVDGNPTERVLATEIWTFVRARGGHWILSAIQQTR